MSFESEELDGFASKSPSIPKHESHHPDSTEQPTPLGPYIRVVHHPHSGLPDEFIYRDATIPTPSTGEASPHAGLSAEFTKRMLKGVTESWVDPGHGKVTFINLDDYKAGLEAARNWVPEWILSLVTDATLAKHLIWYPGKKYLHDSNIVTQLYDGIDSGKSWWDIQTALPSDLDLPYCFLPLHIWLDKGKVSTTVKFHPALLQAGFLPGDVRNGSGNGGAVLFLMMPVVEDPHDPKSRTEAQRAAFAFFKQSIYHQVLMVTLQPLQYPSQYGEAVTCSDSVQRVLTTGIIIQSVDGEEAACTCDDLGKWGDHLFPKMIEVLGNMKQGGKFSEFMSHIPSWPGLKIVHNVITVDFSAGNTFRDIMKTTLPCIVQLFPSKSSFIHCIHALATFWMFAGLHMITTLQLDRMQAALCEYEKYCKNVESQIITIDANKEALAYIAMDVEIYDNELKELKALCNDNNEENKTSTDISNVVHQYLVPDEIILTGYKIIPYKCVYIHYTSLEDWKVKQDITHWKTVDMGVVQWLKEARWKPKTTWKNCQVFEEKGKSIIFLKYVVRACHMIPTFDGPDKTYYLNDMVDADMFLRCGN
ncbi:hypothetical protein BU17DRAFT_67919 [Hysterangium stoloniferum]|nr:hypothetical protein BU17DRAFT_67919 [Hysterangium stoloniferum]